MTEPQRPLSPKNAPDPSRTYERSRPEDEAGMGRLDSDRPVPSDHPDHMKDAVSNTQPPRQLNAQDGIVNERATEPLAGTGEMPAPEPVDHSMLDEEPDGWDLAPMDIKDPKNKRHPRIEGKGGTP